MGKNKRILFLGIFMVIVAMNALLPISAYPGLVVFKCESVRIKEWNIPVLSAILSTYTKLTCAQITMSFKLKSRRNITFNLWHAVEVFSCVVLTVSNEVILSIDVLVHYSDIWLWYSMYALLACSLHPASRCWTVFPRSIALVLKACSWAVFSPVFSSH